LLEIRMKLSRGLLIGAAASLALAGCGKFSEAMTSHRDVVARAAGRELKVEDAAELLYKNREIPADPQVVRALADIWVDYTLLFTAALEDPSLAHLNLDHLSQESREQMLVYKLRDEVIALDTAISDQELERRWMSEGPGVEVRARHILLRLPADASPAQRDSVQALAESLRGRAAGGEDFEALARQYSQDPGSAQRGGDLDYFGRGRMVAPFEEAAFKLEAGEVSPVVESPFGLHVIRVEDRRQQPLDDQRDQFRAFLQQRQVQEAEQAFLDSLAQAKDMAVHPGGLELVREIAAQPERTLSRRAAERRIATYQGGEFTSGEFVSFIRSQPPQMQAAFASANDEQLEGVIKQLTQKELLIAEAGRRGITVSAQEEEELRSQARRMVDEFVAGSGLRETAPRSAAEIDPAVREFIRAAIAGERQLVPLGPVGAALRDQYGAEIHAAAFPDVVKRMEQQRGRDTNAPAPPGSQAPREQGTPAPAQGHEDIVVN
jgi:peptidyl-prolyl cis-trans isomerase C